MYFFRVIKKISLLAFIAFLPLSTFAQTFPDVPQYYKYSQAIDTLNDEGIINGYSDGFFQPGQTISRAEATKLIIASQNSLDSVDNIIADLYFGRKQVYFSDINLDDWYTPYIAIASQNGVIQGYSDGSFRPNKQVNFAEGLKIILEGYSAISNDMMVGNNKLLYVNDSEWFAHYFAYAYNKNLINRAKFYHPAQSMTRGEFAEILYRLRTIQSQNLAEFPATDVQYSDEYTVTIPKLNIINLKVSFADLYNESKALETLKTGLGHYMNPPGDGKKVVIFGHSSGYSWDNSAYKHVLRQINNLQNGDRIYINYQEKGYVYQVANQKIVAANSLQAVLQEEDYYNNEEVALYTCWPPDSVRQRYVVYAVKI